MAADFGKVADEFMKSQAGAKFSGKKDELNKLIGSEDGQKVKKIIESGGADLMSAVQKGDMDTLKGTLSDILKTEEGARLADQIMKMIK